MSSSNYNFTILQTWPKDKEMFSQLYDWNHSHHKKMFSENYWTKFDFEFEVSLNRIAQVYLIKFMQDKLQNYCLEILIL